MTDSSWTSTEPRDLPSGGVARGRVAVPPSKSASHRCFALATVARRPLIVERPLDAEDTRLFLGALKHSGWSVREFDGGVGLEPVELPPAATLDCGNAGTMLRLLVAGLAAIPGRWTLGGTPRLCERPIGPLTEALRNLGVELEFLGAAGCPPVSIRGGSLRGGRTLLDAGQSSQYLSALLIAGLAAPEGLEVEVTALRSSPYVDLTLEAIARFGGRVERPSERVFRVHPGLEPPERVVVEGDYSAACYPAAAAVLTGGEVELEALRRDSVQGDRRFFEVLEKLGGRVRWDDGRVRIGGDGALEAVEEDFGEMPDQVPTLAALAPFARGVTRISGVPHLRIKESDRLAAMTAELRRLGAVVEEKPDGLVIPGVWAGGHGPSEAVTVKTYDDHRIAMSLALTALRRPGVRVSAPNVVAKSYPDFWADWTSLFSG